MYTENAIERLNNIDWNNIGENGQEKDMELGIEFLAKMEKFCNENSITPTLPFMTDLPSFLGNYVLGEEILNRCNSDLRNIIDNPTVSTVIVKHYIKASVLADSNVKYVACMDVYEPIIRLFENIRLTICFHKCARSPHPIGYSQYLTDKDIHSFYCGFVQTRSLPQFRPSW
ncbi:MAG: hypothetical protein K2K10_07055 [Acetatifactor sp.]|nr:hypothetical protein [Acetatifactor sp.]